MLARVVPDLAELVGRREHDAEVLVAVVGRRVGAFAHVDVRRADRDREPVGATKRFHLVPAEELAVEVEHLLAPLVGQGSGRNAHGYVTQVLRLRHTVAPDSGCGEDSRRG